MGGDTVEPIFIVAFIGLGALLLVTLSGQTQRPSRPQTAVLVVDMQGDFTALKKGALAVAGTDSAYVALVRDVTERLHGKGYPVFACQDWHPPDHISFFTNHPETAPFDTIMVHNGREQILWPPHCIQNTENAELLIDDTLIRAVVQKGKNPLFDSYSGFQDDGGKSTGLDAILKVSGVDHLILYGLATDYCVRATVQDAVHAGYGVTLVTDLCCGVDPVTTAAALEVMRSWGVRMMTAAEIDRVF
jgi:nicotinamidase/pyrazinamidase